MNLHGVSAAQGNLRAALAGQVGELPPAAGLAVRVRLVRSDLRLLISPDVERQQRPPQRVFCAYQELDGLGCLDGSDQVDRAVQYACRVAGLNRSFRRSR